MAKQSKKQQQEQIIAEMDAQAKANMAATEQQISDDYRLSAEKAGDILGAYSKFRFENKESMAAVGATLVNLVQEGYVPVGIKTMTKGCCPLQEQFIRLAINRAWVTAHGTAKMEISQDQILSNTQTAMRTIARAAMFDGFLYDKEGNRVEVRRKLLDKLKQDHGGFKGGEGTGRQAGGFWAAKRLAQSYLDRAKQLAEVDADFARQTGVMPVDGNATPPGNPMKAPSPEAWAEVAKRMPVWTIEQTLEALAKLKERVVSATLPEQHVSKETLKRLDGLRGKLASDFDKLLDDAQAFGTLYGEAEKAAAEAQAKATADAAEKAKAVPDPTHTDEVTAKRRSNKAGKQQRASRNVEDAMQATA